MQEVQQALSEGVDLLIRKADEAQELPEKGVPAVKEGEQVVEGKAEREDACHERRDGIREHRRIERRHDALTGLQRLEESRGCRDRLDDRPAVSDGEHRPQPGEDQLHALAVLPQEGHAVAEHLENAVHDREYRHPKHIPEGLRLIGELAPADVYLARGLGLLAGHRHAFVGLGGGRRLVRELREDRRGVLAQAHRPHKVGGLLLAHALDGLTHAEEVVCRAALLDRPVLERGLESLLRATCVPVRLGPCVDFVHGDARALAQHVEALAHLREAAEDLPAREDCEHGPQGGLQKRPNLADTSGDAVHRPAHDKRGLLSGRADRHDALSHLVRDAAHHQARLRSRRREAVQRAAVELHALAEVGDRAGGLAQAFVELDAVKA